MNFFEWPNHNCRFWEKGRWGAWYSQDFYNLEPDNLNKIVVDLSFLFCKGKHALEEGESSKKNVLGVWDSSLEAYWSPLSYRVEINFRHFSNQGKVLNKSRWKWIKLLFHFFYFDENWNGFSPNVKKCIFFGPTSSTSFERWFQCASNELSHTYRTFFCLILLPLRCGREP